MSALEPLVGRWTLEASMGGHVMVGGWASFEWIEGGAFLLHRADAAPPGDDVPREWRENAPFPVLVIIGSDEFSGRFSYLYTDARGVHRVYSMTLEDGLWRITGRAGARFFQRFEGRFADDGRSIAAQWERSADGVAWEKDFDLLYARATPASGSR